MFLWRKARPAQQKLQTIPTHIAIIMDGNGRWAKKRGLARSVGHAAGSETFRRMATYCKNRGVKYLTVYAFSTENWQRPEEEVSAIMSLFEKYLSEAVEKMAKERIALKILGDMDSLSPKIRGLIAQVDHLSTTFTPEMTANLCINYGGRAEILKACREMAQECVEGRLRPEEIDEQTLACHLYTAGMPDPDLIIRPSGELRLSNFLLWQCAYAELYFTETLWPDFDENEMERALRSFENRSRRFGGLKI